MTTVASSEKLSVFLAEFRWGDPAAQSYYRLTDFTSDISFQSLTYVAESRMSIQGLQISGIFDGDTPIQFILPMIVGGITDIATSGARHSPIYVTLWEKLLSTSGGVDQVLTLFRGEVVRVVRNHNGRADFVLFEAYATKQRLAIPLGLVAGHNCQWPFGGRGCDLAVPTENGTVSAIDGKTVTITGLAGHVDRYWHRGFVQIAGLRIPIRDWENGTTFELMAEPPAEWAGATAAVFAGCDKTIERCRFWGNEARFSGFGISIPAYNPIIEAP